MKELNHNDYSLKYGRTHTVFRSLLTGHLFQAYVLECYEKENNKTKFLLTKDNSKDTVELTDDDILPVYWPVTSGIYKSVDGYVALRHKLAGNKMFKIGVGSQFEIKPLSGISTKPLLLQKLDTNPKKSFSTYGPLSKTLFWKNKELLFINKKVGKLYKGKLLLDKKALLDEVKDVSIYPVEVSNEN